MKKHFIASIVLIFAFVGSLFAQQRTLKGTVTSAEDGAVLPGVNVIVKGTSVGSVTNASGQYAITASPEAKTLVFSFIGMQTKEVAIGNSDVIDVTLSTSAESLQEVVVTAFGVKRSEKALGYSVSQVSGTNFVQARETNVGNSLAGRVAGVSVASQRTGPSGSTRVIIRGNTSLTGSNQPLYVVDGVPIDNKNLGNAGMWGGSDAGDGISSINPDDIESMSVLKGGSAAALYGSQASNGVILITTKSGQKSKGVNVEFNTNFTWDKAVSFLNYQKTYGQGTNGHAPTTVDEANIAGPGGANLHTQSFGGKMDGSSVIQWDGVYRPYSYAGNAQNQFYQMGSTFTNTLAITGGNENGNFRIAASQLDNQSVIPNAPMRRNTFTVNTNFKREKFSGTVSGTYVMENVKNFPIVSDVPRNVNTSLLWWPTSIPVATAKGDPDKLGADPETGMELLPSSNTWGGNPYWAAYQSTNNRTKDRLIGTARLRYDPTKWMYVQGRMGLDKFNYAKKSITPYGEGYSPYGDITQSYEQFTQANEEFILGLYKDLDMGLRLSALAGGNMMQKSVYDQTLSGSTFSIPFFEVLSNTTSQTESESMTKSAINSLFYSAEVSYKAIYLTTTGRKDWFSSLDGRSVFYPSVSLSAVISDLVKLPVFDYLKVRTAWSQVGGATDPYSTRFGYSLGTPINGYAQGSISSATLPNRGLRPLLSTEFEVGTDMRFFGNRLGIDVSYYNRKTTDDILDVALTAASGYTSTKKNIGEVSNKGIELLVSVDVIKNTNFSWTTIFNTAYNKSKVVSLVDAEDKHERMQMEESRSLVHWIYQVEGMAYGQVMAYDYLRDASGKILLDANGLPQQGTELLPWGSGVAPTNGGWTNTFRYKNFTADILVDYQFGGHIASGTNFGAYAAGLHKATLVGRGTGLGVLSNNDLHLYYETIANNIGAVTVYKSDFIKLRQISIGYNFPSSVLNKIKIVRGLNFSIVGRNLAILYKKAPNIDPESNYQNGNAQGLEFGGYPSTRSLGFNLNAKF